MATGMIIRSDRAASRAALNRPVFAGLQLAAVAASALRVEEQVVALQQLCDVRLQCDQIRGILGVAADGNRPRDMPVQQAERSAEQVDAGRNDRRPDLVVVEHQRLDQVVGVALVIRGVDDAALGRRGLRDLDALLPPLDLPQDGVERVLQGTVERIPLRRPKLVQISMDALVRLARS